MEADDDSSTSITEAANVKAQNDTDESSNRVTPDPEQNFTEVTSTSEIEMSQQKLETETLISKIEIKKDMHVKSEVEIKAFSEVKELESKSEQEIICCEESGNSTSEVIPTSKEDVVRTLFVSGLPMDATSRELYLLCRSYKGYLDCKLNNARNKFGKPLAPIGFVTYATREEAEAAMAALQDVIFDPHSTNTVRLEFAKCNSKVQIQKTSTLPQLKKSLPAATTMTPSAMSANVSVNATASTNFQRASANTTSGGLSHDSYGSPYYPHPNPSSFALSSRSALPYTAVDNLSTAFYHPELQPQHGLPYGDTLLRAYSHQPSQVAFLNPLSSANTSHTHNQGTQQQQQQQLPSSTLFVANLGMFVTEKELADVFANTPGFLNVTLYKKGISPVAFVKYIDVRCAALAMTALQGSLLRYSDRGGIRIEFARSKMGDRDDSISMCGSAAGFSDGDNNLIPNGWPPVPLSTLAPWMDPVSNWSVFSS